MATVTVRCIAAAEGQVQVALRLCSAEVAATMVAASILSQQCSCCTCCTWKNAGLHVVQVVQLEGMQFLQ